MALAVDSAGSAEGSGVGRGADCFGAGVGFGVMDVGVVVLGVADGDGGDSTEGAVGGVGGQAAGFTSSHATGHDSMSFASSTPYLAAPKQSEPVQ